MSRSLPFRNLARAIRITHYCEENNISTSYAISTLDEGTLRTSILTQRAAQKLSE